MSNNSNKCKPYQPIPKDWDDKGEPKLKDCCKSNTQDDPTGCDCCYDTWSDELKKRQDEFGRANEMASQAKDKLAFSKSKRDGLKKWLDEMVLLDDYSKDICNQFSLIISSVDKICSSSGYTIKAVDILFCMVRDFYSQLDKIKVHYEKLQNCIKVLDATILIPGKGFMKCLEYYNEKLDGVLKTKEDIVKQIMEIIKLANLVQEDVCPDFGLSCVLDRWQCTLGCKPPDGDNNCGDNNDENPEPKSPCSELDLDCIICPQFTFPIEKDKYYASIKTAWGVARDDVDKQSKYYLDLSMEKERIAACISSLKEATTLTDPKERCK